MNNMSPILKNEVSRRPLSISSNVIPQIVGTLDSLAIFVSGGAAFSLVTDGAVADLNYYFAAVAFVWLVVITLLKFGGLYLWDALLFPLRFFDKFLVAFATTFLFLMAAAFSLKISAEFSRVWAGTFALSCCALALFLRLVSSFIVGKLVDRRVLLRHMIVVGSGEQVCRFLTHMELAKPRFVSLLGIFTDRPESLKEIRSPVLGDYNDLSSFVRFNDVDDVVISLPWSDENEVIRITNMLRELPVNVYMGADLIGFRLQFRPPPGHFEQLPLLEVLGRPLAGWGGFQKAVMDHILAACLIVALSPLLVLIAIAIRIESKGPVLFRQARHGFANRTFEIYKFRTMVHAEASEGVTKQATRDDPRITPLGKILRRFSLDELPQLFNVLNGTMSLVGPRPHAIDHNEGYAQMIRGYFARHRVKPGITGWAQVNGFRGETKTVDLMEARVKYDVFYVENWSLLFDLRILAKTLIICITGRNAY
jgi:Undecaprenyl-phosphate glucose phosphotransferase